MHSRENGKKIRNGASPKTEAHEANCDKTIKRMLVMFEIIHDSPVYF